MLILSLPFKIFRRAQTSVESNISGIVLTNETTAIYHSSFNGDITSQDTVRVSTRVPGLPGIVVRSGTDGCVDGGEVDCHYIPGKYSGLGAIKTVCVDMHVFKYIILHYTCTYIIMLWVTQTHKYPHFILFMSCL